MHLPPGLMILQNPEDDEAEVSIDLVWHVFMLVTSWLIVLILLCCGTTSLRKII